jgi:hypothetical protein
LPSIGMAKLFLKVGARPPAPNFGTDLSLYKYHRCPTCQKHNSSLGLARMAPKCLDMHSVLYSGSCRSFSGIRFPFFPQNQLRGADVGIKSFQGKINLFQNLTESGIPAGIPEGSTLDMVFCATCNEHFLRRHKTNRCQ